jgi:hypothetical protein
VTCTIDVKKSYGKRNKEKNTDLVNINYGKGFPQNVYLADFESPNIGLIVFDVFIIVIMFAAVWKLLRSLKPIKS